MGLKYKGPSIQIMDNLGPNEFLCRYFGPSCYPRGPSIQIIGAKWVPIEVVWTQLTY